MKILIVDDEAPARDRLRQIIGDDGEHEVVGQAGNGRQCLELAARLRPDVVLLDIRMPGMSGLETAHHLNDLADPPAIVFTTAYDEYAVDAFDAMALGYVLKPVRRERLRKALAQAARITGEALTGIASAGGEDAARRHVCVQQHGDLKLIPLKDIAFFQADQKYTRVSDGEREYLIDDSLKQLEGEFAERFVRIHRNALVSVAHVEALTKTADGDVLVRLRGNITPMNDPLKVSRRHVATVRRRLRGAGE